jgi:hypothetical protein
MKLGTEHWFESLTWDAALAPHLDEAR